jgi:hypothetical protein
MQKNTMIYRVVHRSHLQQFPLDVVSATTSRAPGNVPYFVDNIWEWLRPDHMPSRRRASFASPEPELAALGAGGSVADAYQVELLDRQPAVQIVRDPRPEDARFHSDVARLKTLVLRQQLEKSWYDLPATERLAEATLFLPCATASEIEEAIRTSQFLNASEIQASSTFWSDVDLFAADEKPPHPRGEIFFAGAYRITPLHI